MIRRRVAVAAMMMTSTLAGCAGGPSLLPDNAAPGPELTMPGRWMLSAPNAPACGMNFSGKPGATEGIVSPEGGCPERFFTSRRWTLQQSALTISDDDNNQLALLNYAGGHFEGKSNTDTPVTLDR
jgi:hypothetical protein